MLSGDERFDRQGDEPLKRAETDQHVMRMQERFIKRLTIMQITYRDDHELCESIIGLKFRCKLSLLNAEGVLT